jgi:hypothetical protein
MFYSEQDDPSPCNIESDEYYVSFVIYRIFKKNSLFMASILPPSDAATTETIFMKQSIPQLSIH